MALFIIIVLHTEMLLRHLFIRIKLYDVHSSLYIEEKYTCKVFMNRKVRNNISNNYTCIYNLLCEACVFRMYVLICVYMYLYMYVCVCIYVCMYVYMWVNTYICVCVSDVHVFVCLHAYNV